MVVHLVVLLVFSDLQRYIIENGEWRGTAPSDDQASNLSPTHCIRLTLKYYVDVIDIAYIACHHFSGISCCQVIDLPWFVKEADRNWGSLLSMPQFPRPKSNFIWTHMKSYEMLKHFEALRLLGLRNPMQFMQHFFSVLPGTSIHVCAKPSACLSVVKLKPQSARSCATGSAYHLLACLPPSCF